MKEFPAIPPFKIKSIEPVRLLSFSQRSEAIRRAGYNTFLLHSRDVTIDLLTDSGTNAMSQEQWGALMRGDEAYAGSESFSRLEDAVRKVYGFSHTIPTHQGRGAEHLLCKLFVSPGKQVLSNMYFTTTRTHVELLGGAWNDVSIAEAHNPESEHPFKGNVDFARLEALLSELTATRIAFVRVETNLNMAGGQPVSFENLRMVRALCKTAGVPLIIDGTRAVENAYFIQQREKEYAQKSIGDILREIFSLCDVAYFSSKKDHLVNIGGFVATNRDDIAEKLRELVVVYEGLHTYGGMSGRDMEALAQGIYEAIDDAYVAHRVGQVQYLGNVLYDAGIPIVLPVGGHAVNVDAARFLPHLDQEVFPAQALAAAIYKECGVRGMERGIVSSGRDPKTGKNRKPKLELVRLAIPRRVYMREHLDVVADGILRTFQKRQRISGLRMTYEPRELRFFQARFECLPPISSK